MTAARQRRSARANVPLTTTCARCGKISYQSRREARRAAARIRRDRRMRAYRCGDAWHITSAGASSTAYHRTSGGAP